MSGTSDFAGISFGLSNEKTFKEIDEAKCNQYSESVSDFVDFSMKTYKNPYGLYKINGNVTNASILSQASMVKFMAPNPPSYGISFAGSGLPYPTPKIAYENTPNAGVVPLQGGQFTLSLNYPNSYYDNMGTQYIEPEVRFAFIDSQGNKVSKYYRMQLGDGIPFRSLTFPRQRKWCEGPMFYNNPDLPIRTQEQILRESAYPKENKEPANFWGLTPTY